MRCRCGPHRCITKVTAYWNTDGQERCLLQSSHSSLNHLNLSDELFGEEGSGLLVPCVVPQPRHNFTLTWTFIRTTESIVIFTYDSRTRRIANLWESKAEFDIDQAHLGNGSLHLLNPDSLGHSGAYICTFYGFQMRHQVQTHVNITVRVTGEIYFMSNI